MLRGIGARQGVARRAHARRSARPRAAHRRYGDPLRRLRPPQFVFVPTRLNLAEITAAFDLAVSLGCSAFVTGPLMRIGRAALSWQDIGPSDADWQRAATTLREHARLRAAPIALSIYPWD